MSKLTTDNIPIGITMGCPAGIGPEVIIKYFNNCLPKNTPPAIVIGNTATLADTADNLGINISFSSWHPGDSLRKNVINVLDFPDHSFSSVTPGYPNLQTGTAMAAYIMKAVDLCNQGLLMGITTCPISKKTLNEAGYNFPGHTEFLRSLTDADQAVMMMAGNRLNIVLATIHCSLSSVPSLIKAQPLEQLIQFANMTLKIDFNIDQPKIAVAGLNPHAGESGLFGTEEQSEIIPAIKRSSAMGIGVKGPFPADTVFNKAASGEFDIVICMYHDQGLIPFKLLHFDDGVNITLGLPIVRTSVDHGTAYDIAGKGLADSRSLEAAVTKAADIAANRNRHNNKYI